MTERPPSVSGVPRHGLRDRDPQRDRDRGGVQLPAGRRRRRVAGGRAHPAALPALHDRELRGLEQRSREPQPAGPRPAADEGVRRLLPGGGQGPPVHGQRRHRQDAPRGRGAHRVGPDQGRAGALRQRARPRAAAPDVVRRRRPEPGGHPRAGDRHASSWFSTRSGRAVSPSGSATSSTTSSTPATWRSGSRSSRPTTSIRRSLRVRRAWAAARSRAEGERWQETLADRISERLRSRLHEMAEVIELRGEDFRARRAGRGGGRT